MNIDKANYVLGKAIAGFQDDEIKALSDVFDEAEEMPMQCMECGATFKSNLTEAACAKCGSFETELA